MNLSADLAQRLSTLEEQGLLRKLRRVDSPQGIRIQFEGKQLLNFSSNDYLGLANHPLLKAAAIHAIEKYGVGAGASRLICGSLKLHHELEEALAAFKRTPAALGFSSGYTAAVGVLCALMGKEDVLILDKLVHASIIDAARLSGAQLQIFRHNDIEDLENTLRSSTGSAERRSRPLGLSRDAASRNRLQKPVRHSSSNSKKAATVLRSGFEGLSEKPRTLIVTESIFSMDGDRAPLREIVALKEKYGVWLMVDEAHATGLYGPNHSGLADEAGVSDHVEIQMGTLGKALGSAGGYVSGSRALIDFLINRARPFVFSTAPVPAAAAAATAAIRLVQSAEGDSRRSLLRARVSELCSHLDPEKNTGASHIIPLLLGAENQAVKASEALRRNGIFIPGIRYPTVARNKARLRITLSASHTRADVNKLVRTLAKLNLGTHPNRPIHARPFSHRKSRRNRADRGCVEKSTQ
jgi:7-keto-8-aminopelargonate synthetase-like enzyme